MIRELFSRKINSCSMNSFFYLFFFVSRSILFIFNLDVEIKTLNFR